MNTTSPPTDNSRSNNSSSVHATPQRPRSPAMWWFDLQLLVLWTGGALAFGGRDEVGRLVFLVSSFCLVLTFIVLRIREPSTVWYWTGAEWLLAAGLLVLCVQLIPLPDRVLTTLSPQIHASLPIWHNGSDNTALLPSWNTLSLQPAMTRQSLAVYVGYAMLFLAVCQRIRRQADVDHVLYMLAVAGSLLALVGWIQFLSGTERYLGWYHDAHRSAAGTFTGPFTNRNHFAHFLLLTCPALVYTLIEGGRGQQTRWRVAISWLALTVVLLALLFSFSRGVLLALSVGVVVGLLCAWGRGLLQRRLLGAVLTLVLAVIAALSVYGWEPLLRRLGSLLPGSEQHSAIAERWNLWCADARAVWDFLFIGSGAGTHASVYPRYLAIQYPFTFTHAENSYLQIALETGLVGTSLLLIGLGVAVGWTVRAMRWARTRREVTFVAVLVGGLLAGAIHNLVDFPWYIPACMSLYVVLLAVVCRCGQMWQWETDAGDGSSSGPVRPTYWRQVTWQQWAGASIVVSAAAAVLLPPAIADARARPYWNAYLRRAASAENVLVQDTAEARQRIEELIELLQQTVRYAPNHDQAWSRIAVLRLRLFDLLQQDADNAMNAAQLRSAVYAAQFPTTSQARAWLARAIGANLTQLHLAAYAAHRALRLAPWNGEAYTVLAEVAFLISPERELRSELLRQAGLVRPYDGFVLFAQGVDHLEQGHVQDAIELWRAVYHNHARLQEKLTHYLVGKLPTAAFIQFFAPGPDTLWVWIESCRRFGWREEAEEAARQFVSLVEHDRVSNPERITADRWWKLSECYWLLRNMDRSVHALRNAVEAEPEQLSWRRTLAQRCEQLELWDQAVAEWRYCVQRRPYDESLQAELARVEKKRRVASRPTNERQPVDIQKKNR